jgi:hypothetical protein
MGDFVAAFVEEEGEMSPGGRAALAAAEARKKSEEDADRRDAAAKKDRLEENGLNDGGEDFWAGNE